MYKSPIEITECFTKEISKKHDEYIYQGIVGYGVNVDRDELIKALLYDRRQYDVGFIDGMKAFAERLKEKKLPCDFVKCGMYWCVDCSDIDNLLKELAGGNND